MNLLRPPSARLPATSMLRKDVAPTRKLIVADPGKLTYFARANAVRAGVSNWGFLQNDGFSGFAEAAPSPETASSSTTQVAGGLQTVGDLFAKLGQTILGSTPARPTVTVAAEPDPVPYVAVGVGAAVIAGIVAWKLAKKM